ncbi:MAG: hypothetical protein Q7V88_09600 [Actinomycetota bacterium]|nr:hypothetical protein [Actinomycetota bacterium]
MRVTRAADRRSRTEGAAGVIAGVAAMGLVASLSLALAVAGVRAAADSSPSDVMPGVEAQAAIAALAVPSWPQPLGGSTEVTDVAHGYAAGCDSLRAAYLAAAAPVPDGTEVTVAADGGLRFHSRFGDSAAFVSDDAGGGCTYELRTSPTLVMAGTDVELLTGFHTVSCFEPFSIGFLAIIELADPGGAPLTIVIGQGDVLGGSDAPQPFTYVSAPATAAEMVASNAEVPGVSTIEGLSGTYDNATGSGIVHGEGTNGPIDISFQCTVTNFQIPGL